MILDEILAATEPRAAAARLRLDEFRRSVPPAPAPSLEHALSADGLSVIAEVKRRSPSAGAIDVGLDPGAVASSYTAGGCAAVSVLTEPQYFGGSLEDLAAVRAAVTVPVLRKDFTIDPAQIWEARAAGADAVLLIVAALDDALLAKCLGTAEEAGVGAIVEVHTRDEARRALDAGARIVGVNNRDLTTFATDLSVAESIAPLLDDVPVTIAESGVSSVEGARRMASAGYDAILVGEALVRHADPSSFVAELRNAS